MILRPISCPNATQGESASEVTSLKEGFETWDVIKDFSKNTKIYVYRFYYFVRFCEGFTIKILSVFKPRL